MKEFLKKLLQEKLKDFLSTIDSDIRTGIDIKHLETLIKKKTDVFLNDTRLRNLTNNLQSLVLYQNLEILKLFNKSGKISGTLCYEELLLNIYNNCINARYKITEQMTYSNYYNMIKMIHDKVYDHIGLLDDDEETNNNEKLFTKIKPDDRLVSLNIIKYTKFVICLLQTCNKPSSQDSGEDKEEEKKESDESGNDEEESDESRNDEEINYIDENLIPNFERMMENQEREKVEQERKGMQEEEKLSRKLREQLKDKVDKRKGFSKKKSITMIISLLILFFAAVMKGYYVIKNPKLKNVSNTLLIGFQDDNFNRHDTKMINEVLINSVRHVLEEEQNKVAEFLPPNSKFQYHYIAKHAKYIIENIHPQMFTYIHPEILRLVFLLQNDQYAQDGAEVDDTPVQKYQIDIYKEKKTSLLDNLKNYSFIAGVSAVGFLPLIANWIINIINYPVAQAAIPIVHDLFKANIPYLRSHASMTRSGKQYNTLGLRSYLESNGIGYHPSNGFYYL